MSTESTTTVKADRAMKHAQAIALRRAGWGYARIGKELGIATTTAHKYVKATLKEAAARRAADADLVLEGELDRLDRLQTTVWVKALHGDIEAVRACLAVLNQRAKLLGLEAPVKVEISRKDLLRITQDMGRVVEAALTELVADPETRNALALRIRDGWLAIEG